MQIALRPLAAIACCLLFGACEYESPITPNPTRKIEEKLLGDWVGENGIKMKLRKLDDFIYVIDYHDPDEGNLLLRAFHSDFADTPFVSVQNIETPRRKYVYFAWNISDDGKRLEVRSINNEIVPKEAGNSESVQKLLKKNLKNKKLFDETMRFTLKKPLASPSPLPADEGSH